MRVISGDWRGKPIKTLSNSSHLRPTQQKVKEAVVNILRGLYGESSFLDLFSGTGSFGFEAASNGAKHVVFVEKNHNAAKTIKENMKNLSSEPGLSWEVIKKCSMNYLAHCKNSGVAFDLIVADPPYEMGWELKVLKYVANHGILTPGGILLLESSKREELPQTCETLTRLKQHTYGETKVSTYKMQYL